MKQTRVKIAAATTLAALGGLAAVAVGSNGSDPVATPASPEPQVRTQIIRRTVTVHAPAEDGTSHRARSAGSSHGTTAHPVPAVQAVQPVRPLVTRSSPGGRESDDDIGEHEVEHEHGELEGGDD